MKYIHNSTGKILDCQQKRENGRTVWIMKDKKQVFDKVTEEDDLKERYTKGGEKTAVLVNLFNDCEALLNM